MNWYLLFENEKELEKRLIINRVGKVQIHEHWVCVLRTNRQLLAFDEKCPHQDYSLAGASCVNDKIVCPLHKFEFSVNSLRGHGLSLSAYEIKRMDGKYYIKL